MDQRLQNLLNLFKHPTVIAAALIAIAIVIAAWLNHYESASSGRGIAVVNQATGEVCAPGYGCAKFGKDFDKP